MKYSIICFFYIILVIQNAYSFNYYLDIEGIESKIYQNIKTQISDIVQEELIVNNHILSNIEKTIKKRLKPFGYYESKVKFNFIKKTHNFDSVLNIKVILGKPIILNKINIELYGEAQKDPDYKKIIEENFYKIGNIQNDEDYESLKYKIVNLAVRNGYFDAIMKKSQLGILLNKYSSYWYFNFNSGKRYKFGKILYKSSQINKDYLNNILPFIYGEDYNSDKLIEFHRRLIATDWFSSVIITPLILNAKQSNSYNLPIEIITIPKTKNFIEFGVGYSTDVGSRIKATWNRPWVNFYGQSLISNIRLANQEQLIDAFYKIPLQINPLEQFYIFQSGFKRTNLNDTQSNTSTFYISRNWNFSDGWKYDFNTNFMFSDFTQANITNRTKLIFLGAKISRIRQRGDIIPTWGDSQNYSIEHSNNIWKSDVNFFIFQAKHVWIRTLFNRHRFVLRSNFGYIITNDFEKIPPDLRFFAGGDEKIRGYGYQKISPKDDQGKLVGASKLLFTSIEYQYNFSNNWWKSIFIDIGEAVNNIKMIKLKPSIGVGIRWISPVGPIKFDLAVPVIKLNEDKIQFYIGLGAEL